MPYTYQHPHAAVTVDITVFTVRNDELNVLLIKRADEPYQGEWALPGGFVHMDESLEQAAERELVEETGVSGVYLEQLYSFGDPGRDPREQIEVFEFDQTVYSVEDLKPGMELPGIVTNITKFGAFVDVGVKQDGLVHISQLADRFVKDPNDIVKIHQHVKVRVLEVDIARNRIQLSMKGLGK